jgi:glycosyltransferase involved in cell wall biosynthesis
MAKVSIIVPTYNVEMYLAECMESIVRQTLKDIEIICINDGSTDGSLEILKQYAARDERIRLVDKENGGYGLGMNVGLDMSTGEYIGIVEPDDFVPLNMYEDLYRIATVNDLDLVKADFYRFKRAENGSIELDYNHLSKNPEDYNVVFNPSEQPETLRYIMNTWSGIYRRSFINEHHIRHNETPGASFQDNGFYFQTFVYAKRGMIIDRPYYMNRRDNPNSSVHNKQKVYCLNVEYDYIREILQQNREIWERFKGMYWFKKYLNYCGTVRRIAPEFKREYVIRFSREFKRGMELGELDETLFAEREWSAVLFLIADPEGYYISKVLAPKKIQKLERKIENLTAQNTKLKMEVNELRNSTAFRIGRILTFIPGKIKRLFKRRRG